MKRAAGFTVIELVIVIVFVATAATLLFFQKDTTDAVVRDDDRKVAINAMYYNLEEVYYAKNGYYPEKIGKDTLTAMDPALFTDPNGVSIGEAGSDYRYTTTGCRDNRCKGYTLSAQMEKEAEYVKKNRSDNR